MGPCKPESIEELLKGVSVLLSQPCPDAGPNGRTRGATRVPKTQRGKNRLEELGERAILQKQQGGEPRCFPSALPRAGPFALKGIPAVDVV